MICFLSYCVNCGVELDPSAKKCALCSTPVINPNISNQQNEEKPFSDKVLIPKTLQRKFVAYILTVILVIPNIVLLLVNIFFVRKSLWSLYVLSSSVLAWILFIFPFVTKKIRPYVMWALDTFFGMVYSLIIVVLASGGVNLWMAIVSIILLVSVASIIFIAWSRQKKRNSAANVVHVLTDAMLVSLLSGVLTSYFMNSATWFIVGLICSLCFAAFLGFAVYCERSKHMREWIKKVFYI